jgi:hypothetical protein
LFTAASVAILITVFTHSREVVSFNSQDSLRPRPSPDPILLEALPIILTFTLLLVSTAYGVIMKRRWGRILALALTVLFVWFYPLGKMLALYIWWAMHSREGKKIYPK